MLFYFYFYQYSVPNGTKFKLIFIKVFRKILISQIIPEKYFVHMRLLICYFIFISKSRRDIILLEKFNCIELVVPLGTKYYPSIAFRTNPSDFFNLSFAVLKSTFAFIITNAVLT